MLTQQQLRLVQIKLQTSPENVYREYAQHLFLSSLYRAKNSQAVFFKGGTAYRIAYKSPRFSEDLDFSATGLKLADIEKIILKVLTDLTNTGIACDINESKSTSGGYLAKLYINLFNQKIPIDIQISLRLKINKPNQSYTIVNEYIPTYQILLLAPTLMFAEKIQAALTRSKPRDFYDIYFLLKNGLFTATEKSQLASIKTTLITKKVKFADELAHFLPKSMKALANSFPEPLLVELNKYL